MSSFTREPDSLGMNALSVVLIGPNAGRRRTLVNAIAGPQASIRHQYTEYPDFDSLGALQDYAADIVVVDIDSDLDRALDLVENICSRDASVTVMVYTSQRDSDTLVRCMRAGARELLTEPLEPSAIGEALVRAAARRSEVKKEKKTLGQLVAFFGAKGGAGSTTIASSFAYALAKDVKASVVLVDLDLELGDAALRLGMTSELSIADAMRNAGRLDSDFLSKLLTHHKDSGLAILPAMDEVTGVAWDQQTLSRVLDILKHDFAYVVVDAGSQLSVIDGPLRDNADMLYVVSEVNIPSLRNSHRLLAHLGLIMPGRFEVILNRFEPKRFEVDEQTVAKALGRPPKYRVPNDYSAARKAENTGSPLTADEGGASRAILDMARETAGLTPLEVKKKRFGIF